MGRCCCPHMCLVAYTKVLRREKALNRATTLAKKLLGEAIFRTMTTWGDFKHNGCLDNGMKVNTKQTQRNKKERRKEETKTIETLISPLKWKLQVTYGEFLEGSTEYRRAKVNVSSVFPRESFPLCRYYWLVVSRGSHCVLVFVPQTFPETSGCSL